MDAQGSKDFFSGKFFLDSNFKRTSIRTRNRISKVLIKSIINVNVWIIASSGFLSSDRAIILFVFQYEVSTL